MGLAWLISVLYIKYEDLTYELLKNKRLDNFVINKAISKINDSYRKSKKTKQRLKGLRR